LAQNNMGKKQVAWPTIDFAKKSASKKAGQAEKNNSFIFFY